MALWGPLLLEVVSLVGVLVWRTRQRARGAALCCTIATLFVIADVLYEARPASVARYPYNGFVEALYVLAVALVCRLCARTLALAARPTPTRALRWFVQLGTALPWIVGWPLLCIAELHYLLFPLAAQPGLPVTALILSALYALVHSLAFALVAATAVRAASARVLFATFGLGCLLAGDFEARFVAQLHASSSAGVGTWGWSLGLLSFVGCLAPRGRGHRLRLRVVPLASVQVVATCLTTGLCASFVALSLAFGYLRCERADTFAHLVSFFWLSLTGFAAIGRAAGTWVSDSARMLPRAQVLAGKTRLAVRLPPSAWHLFEGRRLARAHRSLQRSLASWLADAQEVRERRRWAGIVASWMHELQGPLAALEALSHVQTPSSDAFARGQRMARLASRRARSLARRVQRQGERALAGAVGRSLVTPLAALSVGRVEQLVRRAVREAQSRHPTGAKIYVRRTCATLVSQTVACRSSWLRVCVEALVDNALEAGGPVGVSLRFVPSRHALEVHIKDRGPGLSAMQLHQFGRKPLASHKGERVGLGLWGVARRARQWGGSLDARLRARGGSICILRLPLRLGLEGG